ncbi:MAG: hypothetical protein ACE141_14385 [Bryobacteraceae bacterium]
MSRVLLDRNAEVPEHLRFGARRIFKGRTVNLSALCDDPDDQAWLADFLGDGTDPIDDEDAATGESLADDGGAIRQAFSEMPESLMKRDQDGTMVPDWAKILAGIKGQSRKQLEARCLVAEKRFRDGLTQEQIIAGATAGLRGRSALRLRVEKHHQIFAAWRWLDRPENQRKIADVVRQARAEKPRKPEPTIAVQSPTRTDAIGVLAEKARLRRTAIEILDRAAPSIMVDHAEDCHRLGPGWHKMPGTTTERLDVDPATGWRWLDHGTVAVDALGGYVHFCPECDRYTCPICGRLVKPARIKTKPRAGAK